MDKLTEYHWRMCFSRVTVTCPDRMVPWWKSIGCGVSRSLLVACATWETPCGTPLRRRPPDIDSRLGNARVARHPFPVRRNTSRTPPLPLPLPLSPLPVHIRCARSSPDSGNPGMRKTPKHWLFPQKKKIKMKSPLKFYFTWDPNPLLRLSLNWYSHYNKLLIIQIK